MNLPLALVSGAAMGFLLSVLGGGGSLFIIPILLLGFGQSIHMATGTSLVVVLAGAVVGAIGHYRGGRLNLRVVLYFGPASMAGAALGALAHGLVSERVVISVLAVILVIAGLRMLFGKLPPREETEPVSVMRAIPLGMLFGVVTGFVGIGGGFLIVPILVWGAHVALHEAIGTSVALIAVSSLVGAVTHMAQRNVDVGLATAIGLGAVLGAMLGAPLSGKLPERPLRLGFGVMVLAAACYIFIRSPR